MITLQASQIASIVGGVLHGEDVICTQAPVLNSTAALPGSIFLAMKGERVDGHDFVEDARAHGAVLTLATSSVPGSHIIVSDVTVALGKLAHAVRKELKELIVIGLTGSQGKTTTKELLAAILSSQAETVAPTGNFNNELGAPLSLLQCTHETRYCIIEMGARHRGDIAHLCSIVEPNIGLVLRVGSAHVGEFGSVQAIAETKSELISSLSQDGVAILGTYDEYTPAMRSLHTGEVLTFGENAPCDIRASDIEFREGRAHFDLITQEGRVPVGLSIIGLHQVANALAAASVATALEIPLDAIAGALSTAESSAQWRMQVTELNGLVLINDAYNASPEAVAAALSTLTLFAQERGGQSWAFLGKMGELGESSQAEHAALGTLAQELGIDHLVCVAAPEYASALQASDDISVHLCSDKSEAAAVALNISAGDVVLVKASRSEKLEELAELISAQWIARENEEGANQ
jgi:UDP-N-acetylmuramoyl-tripeptide--D-alanyl-D-alanine ligase